MARARSSFPVPVSPRSKTGSCAARDGAKPTQALGLVRQQRARAELEVVGAELEVTPLRTGALPSLRGTPRRFAPTSIASRSWSTALADANTVQKRAVGGAEIPQTPVAAMIAEPRVHPGECSRGQRNLQAGAAAVRGRFLEKPRIEPRPMITSAVASSV